MHLRHSLHLGPALVPDASNLADLPGRRMQVLLYATGTQAEELCQAFVAATPQHRPRSSWPPSDSSGECPSKAKRQRSNSGVATN